MRRLWIVVVLAGVLRAGSVPKGLQPSLTLHASFDRGVDADTAKGDALIYSAPGYDQQSEAAPGTGDVDVVLEQGALRFRSKNTRALFFRGDKHVTTARGTISFWLRLDPQKDLAPGFCDPIQITDSAYNDSAIWVDFTKDEAPRHFRLGIFGELKSWNPADTPPDKNPDFIRRLVVVERPPFTGDQWTHVAITWSDLGTNSGAGSLYLNGKATATASGIKEPFTWNPARLAIRLGVNYVGLMDEVAVFDRALSAGEIESLTTGGR